MVVNLLPLFLANVLGVRISLIGLIEGIAEMTASLLKVFSGWFSDRLGERKWLAVAGYGISTLAKPFFYFAQTWSQVLVVRWADRVGKGIRTAPRDALVADSIDEKQRGLAFGLHRAADTGGAVIGLLIALGVIWAAQEGSRQIGARYVPDGGAGQPDPGGAGSVGTGCRRTGCACQRKTGATQDHPEGVGKTFPDLPADRWDLGPGQLVGRFPGVAGTEPGHQRGGYPAYVDHLQFRICCGLNTGRCAV